MLASPHFRRERFGPGCSDCAGPPGTCPAQAAAAAVCHVRTTGPQALAWPPHKQDTMIAADGHLLNQRALLRSRRDVSMVSSRKFGLISPF